MLRNHATVVLMFSPPDGRHGAASGRGFAQFYGSSCYARLSRQ
jgi:hypothetical protein